MHPLHETLSLGLQLWQELTGIDPEATSMKISDWKLKETFEELQEAIELDPTQVTAILLLAHFVDSYLDARSVTHRELIEDFEGVKARLAKPAALKALLARSEVQSARLDYVQAIEEAVRSYEAQEAPGMPELMAAPHELAVLRRDALRSMARLSSHQFLRGQAEPEGVRPVYNRVVHQVWNIQSALAAITRMPSGVSLVLVRHPDAFQSYFCFVVRNGANLYVVTDVPDNAHPLQGEMRRRPDRDLQRRALRNWFPYGLLDLEYNEESQQLYVKQASERRDLVPFQNVALPLTPIAELEAEVMVWVTMMFDLLVERFWHQGWQAPELSYTAEMIRQNPLLDVAASANLPAVTAYEPVALAPITHADIHSSRVTEQQVGKSYDQPNAWLEERYGAQVPEAAFNVLGTPERQLFLTMDGAIEEPEAGKLKHMTSWDVEAFKKVRTELAVLDATSFGSRQKLDDDRTFLARANYARHIHRLARVEFRAREKEVSQWYRERVMANMPTLLQWAANLECWVDDGLRGNFSGYEGDVGPQTKNSRNFIWRVDMKNAGYRMAGSAVMSTLKDGHWLCVVNKTKASLYVTFSPATAADLALLAGCAVEELPDVLQHWSRLRPYRGNSILNRIDPLVWAVTDPWLKLDLRVALPLSKRAIAAIDKGPLVIPPVANRCERPV